MPGLRGEAAIVGVAEFAPVRKPEKLWMGLEAYSELARMALDDAGLTIRDVDAVLTGNNLQEAQMFVPATIIEYLGIESHFSEIVDLGGASGAGLVLRAAMAIEMGLCETALCMLYTQAHHQNPKASAMQRLFQTASPHACRSLPRRRGHDRCRSASFAAQP